MNEIEKLIDAGANMTEEEIASMTEEQRKRFMDTYRNALRTSKPNHRINNDDLLKWLGATQEGRCIRIVRK